ncbi:kinase-like domain-containing protein, partial [Amanita rubescens]
LRQDFCREALVWRSLSHRFILPLLGIFEDESELYLVSPFMTNETLRQWRNKQTPTTADLHKMMLEVAEGVQYIHSEGIVHGDLHGVRVLTSDAPQSVHLILDQGNVLLDSNLSCKITDFGSSRHFETVISRSTRALVINFAAPELLGLCIKCGQSQCSRCYEGDEKEPTGKTMETDVYAFGCLYYEVRFRFSLAYAAH